MADKVKDPVCGMEIDPKDAAAKEERDGHAFYFGSESLSRRVLRQPAQVRAPRLITARLPLNVWANVARMLRRPWSGAAGGSISPSLVTDRADATRCSRSLASPATSARPGPSAMARKVRGSRISTTVCSALAPWRRTTLQGQKRPNRMVDLERLMSGDRVAGTQDQVRALSPPPTSSAASPPRRSR